MPCPILPSKCVSAFKRIERHGIHNSVYWLYGYVCERKNIFIKYFRKCAAIATIVRDSVLAPTSFDALGHVEWASGARGSATFHGTRASITMQNIDEATDARRMFWCCRIRACIAIPQLEYRSPQFTIHIGNSVSQRVQCRSVNARAILLSDAARVFHAAKDAYTIH